MTRAGIQAAKEADCKSVTPETPGVRVPHCPPSEEALQQAARLWCLPQHGHRVMDPEFCTSIATLLDRYRKAIDEIRWDIDGSIEELVCASCGAIKALNESATMHHGGCLIEAAMDDVGAARRTGR